MLVIKTVGKKTRNKTDNFMDQDSFPGENDWLQSWLFMEWILLI